MSLNHLRVMLIGGSGGIGRAMFKALEQGGAYVIAVGRSWPKGIPPGAISADITSPADRERLLELVQTKQLNTVVFGAGVSAFKPVEKLDEEEVNRLMRVNTIAPMQLSSSLLRYFRSLPESHLVFVGSVLGQIGVPGHALYGASKAALYGFVEAMRRELRPGPVCVQWLAPRATRTDFNDALACEFNQLTGTPTDHVDVVACALVDLLTTKADEKIIGIQERIATRLNTCLGASMDRAFAKHAQVLHQLFSTRT